jgi:hypothetical protein
MNDNETNKEERPFISAMKKDVVLIDEARVDAFKKGLPNDNAKALMDCTYLAQFYANSRSHRRHPDWINHYRQMLKATGWRNEKTVEKRKEEISKAAGLATVTYELIKHLGYPDLGDFMSFHLWRLEKDSDSMIKFMPASPEPATTFQLSPVEKTDGATTTLVITQLCTVQQTFTPERFPDFIRSLFKENNRAMFSATAYSHTLNEEVYDSLKPTITKHLKSIAMTGHTDFKFTD